jgi:hypothetical protein
MFKASNSTVFILGAGASWHYGYPTGETLVEKVKEKAFIAARRMGGAQRYPSTAVGEDDGFREGLNPSGTMCCTFFKRNRNVASKRRSAISI